MNGFLENKKQQSANRRDKGKKGQGPRAEGLRGKSRG